MHFLIFVLINFEVKIDEFLYFEHPSGLLLEQVTTQFFFPLHVSVVWEKEECLILVLNHFYKEGVTQNIDWYLPHLRITAW